MPELISQPGELDLFAIHHANPSRFPFLLESRVVDDKIGRYSLLLGDVTESLQAVEQAELADCMQRIELSPPVQALAPNLPFSGGWLVYIAYEAARHWDTGLSDIPHDDTPVVRADYCASAVIVDHQNQCSHFVSRNGLAEALQAVTLANARTGNNRPQLELDNNGFHEEDASQFESHVVRVIEYIKSGDIYQANISRRWHGPEVSPSRFSDIYAALRERNPASFSASCVWPGFAIASASPERLFRVHDRQIDTRPIAGTRPRRADGREDLAKREELQANPKEQAEHIMLVDLERNDLGRVAEAGSVRVDELLVIESYASVHHLVSNIQARLKSQVGLQEILRAVFPGGTITGCPKRRCMQIIAEMEQRPRGAYTGSVGYVSDCGRMDFNILIRTVVSKNGRLELAAGAGIVADSIPNRELKETRAKAAGVLTALGLDT